MKKSNAKYSPLRKLVLSALLLAMGLVVRQFSIMVPIMGIGGLRVGFSGIFTSMPAILFGPLYGGLVSGASDVLGLILKPEGAWIPQLTLTAILGGVLRGYIWIWIKNLSPKKMSVGIFAFLAALLLLGSANAVVYNLYPQSSWGEFLGGLTSKGESQVVFATYLPVIIAVVGFVILTANYLIDKKSKTGSAGERYILIAFTFLVTGLVITTINTFILIDVYQIKKAFMLFYIPRFCEEVASCMINAYAVFLILPKLAKKI